ncbi:MAG TPA: lysophospholipid acyltransferase family protein [Candidatus Omnitrophota bacterium]|nr:lysophospholipid acyltransferase family protein [Candidatus Omnitrophota bacterium]
MKIKTRRYYVYYCLKGALLLARAVPLGVLLFISDHAGRLAFRFLKKYRQTAIDNLDMVFPERKKENAATAEKVFVNFIKNGAEWVKLLSMGPDEVRRMIPEVRGRENLDEVLSGGKGALVMGFHFGNWELLGIGLRVLGYPGSLVARRIYFDRYDSIITGMRARFDAKVIYRDESPKKMLMELRKGNVLGIVPDQDVDSIDGVFVDFFGRPAYTPTAPVKLASAAGTAIVPVFVIRGEDNRHTMVIEKPIRLPERLKDKEEIRSFTQQWSDVLESYVRRYPDQWVWVHKRWKTVPGEKTSA